MRPAAPVDLPRLVEVDLCAFSSVYQYQNRDPGDLRRDLLALFTARFAKLGGEWITVLHRSNTIVGFIMSCPTSRTPEQFTTWEDMTDHGTLDTTFDPRGRYLYIVTLSVLPEVSHQGGHLMLIANVLGRLFRHGLEQGFFESRLPGLRGWATRRCREQGKDLALLDEAERHALALAYARRTRTVRSTRVPVDRLLRIYHDVGCEFVRLVAGAYQDPPSLNFGVLCVYRSRLPGWLRRCRLVRWSLGGAVLLASRRRLLAGAVFWFVLRVNRPAPAAARSLTAGSTTPLPGSSPPPAVRPGTRRY